MSLDFLFRGVPTVPVAGRAPALGLDTVNSLLYVNGPGGWVVVGGGGGGGGTVVTGEVPSGLINSSNTVYTLVSTPIAGSLALYEAGIRLEGGGGDYTLSGSTITFLFAPTTGDTLLADYRH